MLFGLISISNSSAKDKSDSHAQDNLGSAPAPLIIISPKNGDTYAEGDIVNFVAELSPDFNGSIAYVDLMTSGVFFSNCCELKTHPRYVCKFKIPPASPKKINLFASGVTLAGSIMSEIFHINVVVPANIKLQGLKSFQGNKLYFLGLQDNEQIYVIGVYSDGVERDIGDAGSGTTYSTTNANIVKVSPDGLATSIGPGEAQITVRNGSTQLVLNAVVWLNKHKAK